MGIHWNDEQIDTLKKLAADGMSAKMIAREIGGGLSRNAILGKLFRLGILLGRPKPKPRAAKGQNGHTVRKIAGRFSRKREAAPEVERDPIMDLPADTSPFAVAFMDARGGQCRYPLGEPSSPDFKFCGAWCEDSWCERHRRIVYRPRKLDA